VGSRREAKTYFLKLALPRCAGLCDCRYNRRTLAGHRFAYAYQGLETLETNRHFASVVPIGGGVSDIGLPVGLDCRTVSALEFFVLEQWGHKLLRLFSTW
jgi:hypothetical protein